MTKEMLQQVQEYYDDARDNPNSAVDYDDLLDCVEALLADNERLRKNLRTLAEEFCNGHPDCRAHELLELWGEE